jgi:hypothetical protein
MQRAWGLRQPLVELFPTSPAATAIRACADALMLGEAGENQTAHAFAARLVSAVRRAARSG